MARRPKLTPEDMRRALAIAMQMRDGLHRAVRGNNEPAELACAHAEAQSDHGIEWNAGAWMQRAMGESDDEA